jgi:antitoxin CcdA
MDQVMEGRIAEAVVVASGPDHRYITWVNDWKIPMSDVLFDPGARRKTVSLTINADLLQKARAAGINASRTAEAALEQALREHHREQLRKEFAQDLRAMEDYVDKHGNPNDDWREMCREADAT